MAELSVKYGEMHFTPFVGGVVLIESSVMVIESTGNVINCVY